MIFVTFFPRCENNHLTKEVGLFPYILHRDFGYDSYVICFDSGDYGRLGTDTPGLKLLFMKSCFGHMNAGINGERKRQIFSLNFSLLGIILGFFSLPRSFLKRVNVFNLYHMRFESLLVAFLFRLTNRDGLIYVRMDIDPGVMKSYEKYPQKIVEMSKNILIAFFIKIARVDFVSVETKTLYEYFKERHPVYKKMSKLYYLPMGFNLERVPPRSVCFSDKENLVIHVARIGLPAKRSHIVLESFAEVVRKYKNWKLILIGEMQDSFIEYYNTFLSNNQDVSGNISYLGFISNREHLFDIYSRSKILFLPSQYESFGLATLESGLFGNILLGSDIIAFRELTNNGEYAYLCPSNSSAGFVSMLDYMITHEDEMADKSKIVASYMTDNYDIKTLCMKLRNIIDEINCIRSGL